MIRIEFICKLVSILSFIVAVLTLWFNFLRPPDPRLIIGKKAILIWHDTKLKSAPMIDIFCTILNNGARPIIVDKVQVELLSDNNKANFSDYLFLKLINGIQWQQEEYSHPIVVNKYSERSMMLGVRNEDLKYDFVEGKHLLKVKAINNKNKCIAEDKLEFILF